MKKVFRDELNRLGYVVQCQWPGRSHFETIAGFDNERTAETYARQCREGQTVSGFEYRVCDVVGT